MSNSVSVPYPKVGKGAYLATPVFWNQSLTVLAKIRSICSTQMNTNTWPTKQCLTHMRQTNPHHSPSQLAPQSLFPFTKQTKWSKRSMQQISVTHKSDWNKPTENLYLRRNRVHASIFWIKIFILPTILWKWNENLENWVVNSLFPSSTPTASSLPPIQANLQCARPYNAHTPTASKCLVFLQHFLLYFSVSHFHISIWDGLSLNFAGLGMLMVIILSPRQRWGFRGCPHGATVLHVVHSTRFSVFAQLV